MNKKISSACLLVISLFLVGCDDLYECIVDINPEINENTIRTATINEPYFQRITAEINNEVADDFYEYFFDVVGELPDGIEIEYHYRRIELSGVPTEPGNFRFLVTLTIGAYDDGEEFDPNPTCDAEIERAFILTVAEE